MATPDTSPDGIVIRHGDLDRLEVALDRLIAPSSNHPSTDNVFDQWYDEDDRKELLIRQATLAGAITTGLRRSTAEQPITMRELAWIVEIETGHDVTAAGEVPFKARPGIEPNAYRPDIASLEETLGKTAAALYFAQAYAAVQNYCAPVRHLRAV